MTTSEPAEILCLVAQRSDLIEDLAHGIQDKRELEERLGISRSTLNRALNDLENFNLIGNEANEYKITPSGHIAYHMFREWETFTKALPVLNYLPHGTNLEPSVIRGSDVINISKNNPEIPLDHLERLIQSGSSVMGLVPITMPRLVMAFYAQIINSDFETDLVFSKDGIEYLWTEHKREMRDMVGTDGCTFWEIEALPTLGITIVDEQTVWLGVYDNDGSIKGAILNDSIEAVEWASDIFYQFRNKSSHVFLRGTIQKLV